MMKSIQLKAHVGDDGILHLDLPVDIRNQDLDIIIVIDEVNTPSDTWDDTFFEETAGSLADDPIERLPQGNYESREEIE